MQKTQATVFRLDAELHRALRITALEKGITMTEALRQAAILWLEKQGKKDWKPQKGGKK